MLYYAVPYFFVVLTYSITIKEYQHFKTSGFWIFSLAILSALSFNQTIYYAYKGFIDTTFASEIQYFIKICATKFSAPLVIAGIAYLYWNSYDRKDMNFYGFKSSSYSAYVYMLAGMAPVIIAVSFLPDFIKFYPMYKSGRAEEYWGISRWITFPVYEFCYGSSFLGIELLFRGFFVLALARYLGKAAVFPMVAVYCFYHFGKPMGEAIGSIFGGYILGIIAYYSRSIIGGFLLHAGIAWLMDISAIWQHVSKDEW
ncbi:MAG TPA: CPBP family intramembrane glutamic endopeptidase [Cytophagaceae bacterium]